MAKKNVSKQKKSDVRVDFTPMVDMMMLLITFFMLCTSLAKPQTMELSMPSNDKNLTDQDKSQTKESYTMTIYAAGEDRIFYIEGLPDYEDETAECLQETTWGKNGIRKALITHQAGDGAQPVYEVMMAKAKLDLEKDQTNMEDSVYNKRLADIKKGNIDGRKIETMTIIIKATDNATYTNVIDVLDEMQICSIGKYVLDNVTEDDLKLLEKKGAK